MAKLNYTPALMAFVVESTVKQIWPDLFVENVTSDGFVSNFCCMAFCLAQPIGGLLVKGRNDTCLKYLQYLVAHTSQLETFGAIRLPALKKIAIPSELHRSSAQRL